jgi:hypothetical protein
MAITFPLVTLADGALISKTFVDAVVDDTNHLFNRPDGYSQTFGGSFTATSTTYTQMPTPTITVTPKSTSLLIFAQCSLYSSVAGDAAGLRLDVNGADVGSNLITFPTANQLISTCWFHLATVTPDVAYTIRIEFNRAAGSGTINADGGYHRIYAIEV